MLKRIFPFFLFLFSFAYSTYGGSNDNSFYQGTHAFLKKHVVNGWVNYEGIQKNVAELQGLINQIENMAPVNLSKSEKKSFYINAYNILVIKSVISNWPIKSPMDVKGFFDQQKHKIAGETMTLNDIENNKLRKIYNDPRVHFVLVCGALGCPPITPFAYQANQLDQQLDRQTKLAINNATFTKVQASTKKVLISEIFKWYKEDFTHSSKSMMSFLNKYRTKPIPTNYTIDYYPYDWQLNQKKN